MSLLVVSDSLQVVNQVVEGWKIPGIRGGEDDIDRVERVLREIVEKLEHTIRQEISQRSITRRDIEDLKCVAQRSEDIIKALRSAKDSTSSRKSYLRGRILHLGSNVKAERRLADLSLHLTKVITRVSILLLDHQTLVHQDEELRLSRQIKELETGCFGRLNYRSMTLQPFHDSNRPESLALTVRHEVLSWLKPPKDSEDRHSGYSEMRLKDPETCTWLQYIPQYEHWKSSSRPSCLWIQGRAGSGKSMLMSKVVDDLSAAIEEECFAYFYFGHSKVQTAWEVAAVLLKQLCKKSTTMPKTLQDLQFSCGPDRQPPFDSLLKAFEEIEGSNSRDITILLDAWDTANMCHVTEFERLFNRITSLPWKIFVTSRDTCPFHMDTVHWFQVDMSMNRSSDDFKAFVVDSLDKEISISELSFFDKKDDLKKLIVEKIVEKSDQNFFLAEIQIQRILEQVNIRDIRLTLDELPRSPKEIVHRAFDVIMSQQENLRKLACTSLVWVANTERPLSIEALGEGFAALSSSRALYSTEKTYFDPPSVDNDKLSINPTAHQRSSSLGRTAWHAEGHLGQETPIVTLDSSPTLEREKLMTEPRGDVPDSPKAFAAAFVKKNAVFNLDKEAIPPKKAFLGRFGCCKGLLIQEPGNLNVLLAYDDIKTHLKTYHRYGFTEKIYNQELKTLSLACLYYLIQSQFSSGPCERQDLYFKRLKSNPFLEYSAICWPNHARKAAHLDVEILVSLLFKSRKNLAAAVQVYLVSKLPGGSEADFKAAYESSRSMTPLQIATRLNLMAMIKNLAKENDPLATDNFGNTALHEAMDHGNIEAFKLFFDKIVLSTFDETDGELKASQFFANVKDREALLHFYKTNVLKGNGIRDAIKTNDFPAVLASLCSGEYEENSLIEAAISSHSTKIMQALIRFGAHAGEFSFKAMRQAIIENRLEVVVLLLENTNSTPPEDALFEAVRRGNLEIVKLLLKHGVDINARNPDSGRALLHEATAHKFPDMVKFLLSHGADSCELDNYGRSPLFDAIGSEDVSSIKHLLQHGVDIDAIDIRTGRSALHEAAIIGDEKILTMILNQMLQVDRTDNVNKTAMDYAKEKNHIKIYRILRARIHDAPTYAASLHEPYIPTYDFPDKGLTRRQTRTWPSDPQSGLDATVK